MPLYEYNCDRCDEQFELIRSAGDKDEVLCPSCEQPARKLLSGFAVGGGSSKAGSSWSGGGSSCGWSGG